jgi:hypothetical protein
VLLEANSVWAGFRNSVLVGLGSAGAGEFPRVVIRLVPREFIYYHYYFCFLMYIWNVVVFVISSSWRCPNVGLVMDR